MKRKVVGCVLTVKWDWKELQFEFDNFEGAQKFIDCLESSIVHDADSELSYSIFPKFENIKEEI